MKQFKYLVFITLLTQTVMGQISFQLEGKVYNSHNAPLPFLEVLMMDKDSVVLYTTKTDENGEFSLESKQGYFIFLIDDYGRNIYAKDIHLTSHLDLGSIQIIEENVSLDEVVLEGRKKLIERKIDRLVFNVENSIAAAGGNALDALKVTPGLKILNNKISMTGKSGLQVMINDQILTLSAEDLINYLETIPSDNIQSIEVITMPPAKYGVEGNSGLINIKLKGVKKDSWNAAITPIYLQRKYASAGLSSFFNYNKDRFSLQSSIAIGSQKRYYSFRNKTYYTNEHWKEHNSNQVDTDYLNLKLGMEYQISSKWSSGIQYLGSFYKRDADDFTLTKRVNPITENINSYIKSTSGESSKPSLNSFNWHNLYKLDSIGSKITTDIDFFHYNISQNKNYRGNQLESNSEIIPGTYFAVISSNKNKITNYSGKIDVELPLKWMKIDFGGKIYKTKTDNDINSFNNETGIPVLDTLLSNIFEYTENNQAFYFSAYKEFNPKWEAKLGLRMEATQTRGFSKNYNQTNKNDYIRLFPTAYITYRHNEHNTFSLSYGRRINRPNYEQLNPFRIYNNPNSYVEGNPFLKPSFMDNFEFIYSYKSLESKLYFSNLKDGFQQISIVNPVSNIIEYRYLNFLNVKRYGFIESYTFDKLKWWVSMNSFNLGYIKTKSNLEITQKQLDGYQSSFSTYNDFILNKNKTFLFSANFDFNFSGVDNFDKVNSYSSLSLAFRYVILNKKLQITIAANDIFKTERPLYKSYSNEIKQEFKNYYGSQTFRFSLSYKFGNDQLKVSRRAFGNKEESDRIN